MKRFLLILLLVVFLLTMVSGVFAAGESLYGKYLTVSDVEKVTGLKGLTRKELNLTLEFDNKSGDKVLEAIFDPASTYKQEVDKNPKYYVAVPGIGEKAGIALPNMPYRLTFLKGKYCVLVQSVLGGKTPVSKDQLIAIAKIIAGRL